MLLPFLLFCWLGFTQRSSEIPDARVCALGLHRGSQHHAVHGHIHLPQGLAPQDFSLSQKPGRTVTDGREICVVVLITHPSEQCHLSFSYSHFVLFHHPLFHFIYVCLFHFSPPSFIHLSRVTLASQGFLAFLVLMERE